MENKKCISYGLEHESSYRAAISAVNVRQGVS